MKTTTLLVTIPQKPRVSGDGCEYVVNPAEISMAEISTKEKTKSVVAGALVANEKGQSFSNYVSDIYRDGVKFGTETERWFVLKLVLCGGLCLPKSKDEEAKLNEAIENLHKKLTSSFGSIQQIEERLRLLID